MAGTSGRLHRTEDGAWEWSDDEFSGPVDEEEGEKVCSVVIYLLSHILGVSLVACHLCVCLSVLFVCLSCLSVCLVCLSVCLSVCPSICLFVCYHGILFIN